MNWTGGKLKRHARLHRNEQLKAQRNHFARICKNPHKQETQTPLASSTTFPSRLNQHGSWHAYLLDHQQPPFASLTAAEQQLAHDLENCLQKDTEKNHVHTDNLLRPVAFTIFDARTQSYSRIRDNVLEEEACPEHARQTELTRFVPASMDDMKKKLLAQPDWLGLSTHRPAEFESPSANGITRIGRHKKTKQSTDSAVIKQFSSRNHQEQHCARRVIGKRKHSAQEETPRTVSDQARDGSRVHAPTQTSPAIPQPPWSADRHQPDSIAEARAYAPLPRTPLKDANRQHYHLPDHDLCSEDYPDDLVSLHEVRTFRNFDAVKELQLQIRKSRCTRKDEDSHHRATRSCQTPLPGLMLPEQSTYGDTIHCVQGSALSPPRGFDIRTDKNVASFSYGKDSEPEKLNFQISAINTVRHQPTTSVRLSTEQYAPQLGMLPLINNPESMIAVRNFGITTPIAPRPQQEQNEKSNEHTVGRFRLVSPEPEVHGVSSIFERNAPLNGQDSKQRSGRLHRLAADTGSPYSEEWFKLDPAFDPNSGIVLKTGHDAHLQKQGNNPRHIHSTIPTSSPYLTADRIARVELCNTEVGLCRSQLSSKIGGKETSDHPLGGIKNSGSIHQLQCPGLSFSSTSKPLSENKTTAAAHLQLHSRAVSSMIDQIQQPVPQQEQSFSANSSPPTVQARSNILMTIFSTPPRRPEGVCTVSDRCNVSPYFRSKP